MVWVESDLKKVNNFLIDINEFLNKEVSLQKYLSFVVICFFCDKYWFQTILARTRTFLTIKCFFAGVHVFFESVRSVNLLMNINEFLQVFISTRVSEVADNKQLIHNRITFLNTFYCNVMQFLIIQTIICRFVCNIYNFWQTLSGVVWW